MNAAIKIFAVLTLLAGAASIADPILHSVQTLPPGYDQRTRTHHDPVENSLSESTIVPILTLEPDKISIIHLDQALMMETDVLSEKLSTNPTGSALGESPEIPESVEDTAVISLEPIDKLINENQELVADRACTKISDRLFSVKESDCKKLKLQPSGHYSVKGFPLLVKEYPPLDSREPLGRVLLIGGTHGDELTSVSSVFKWMSKLEKYHSGLFHWHVAPLVNPDGVLREKSRRVNANGVDLNRNLPTPNWQARSKHYWIDRTKRDPRRYPGPEAASEPETRWLIEEIETFQPDIIISVHAPFRLIDFDAPDRDLAPLKIGNLNRRLLGTFPGSLGNYAGVERSLPVLTLELAHEWKMPSSQEITHMWVDLVSWLRQQVPKSRDLLERYRDGVIAK